MFPISRGASRNVYGEWHWARRPMLGHPPPQAALAPEEPLSGGVARCPIPRPHPEPKKQTWVHSHDHAQTSGSFAFRRRYDRYEVVMDQYLGNAPAARCCRS